MKILSTIGSAKATLRPLQAAGRQIALVPTMGALHEGHLSLVRYARARADIVVASIFVNPKQFGPTEDLAAYPRDLDGDASKLESAGCDFVFAPTPAEIYPPGFETEVSVPLTSLGLCGDFRDGHFLGVTTIVMKLFAIVRPDSAVFGEKDFQQLVVLKRMARDLALDVEVLGAPLVREADGLAMSSRNQYLSPEERERALSLSRGLRSALALYADGERAGVKLLDAVRASLSEAGLAPEYLELRDSEDLSPLDRADRPAVIAMVVRVGKARLLDNIRLPASTNTI